MTLDPRQETASDVTGHGPDVNQIETQMERRLRSTIAREENANSNSALHKVEGGIKVMSNLEDPANKTGSRFVTSKANMKESNLNLDYRIKK